MTVTAPPRPPRPSDPVTHGEFEALVEALIEEAQATGAASPTPERGSRDPRRARRSRALRAPRRSAQSQTASPALSARSSLAAAAANSKIAFISEPPGGGYCGIVYVMNADGSGQRRLANGGVPGCGQEGGPAWSPDGRRIAFVSNGMPPGRRRSATSKIYVMNADGSWAAEADAQPWL